MSGRRRPRLVGVLLLWVYCVCGSVTCVGLWLVLGVLGASYMRKLRVVCASACATIERFSLKESVAVSPSVAATSACPEPSARIFGSCNSSLGAGLGDWEVLGCGFGWVGVVRVRVWVGGVVACSSVALAAFTRWVSAHGRPPSRVHAAERLG